MAKRKNVTAATIARHYAERRETLVAYYPTDWGEPSCWACGFYRDSSKVDYREKDKGRSEYACWDRAANDFLEKCHVIPHALTSDDSPGNFVLLCGNCHEESPDTTSAKAFQVWLDYKHETPAYCPALEQKKAIEKAMKVYGVTPEMCHLVMDESDLTEGFKSYYGENTVHVIGQSNPYTFCAAIVGYCATSVD